VPTTTYIYRSINSDRHWNPEGKVCSIKYTEEKSPGEAEITGNANTSTAGTIGEGETRN